MNKSELIKRLEDIEWEDFEVKEAKSEIPKNAWATVSAFSNTAGGWLIFGVSKIGKSYNICGFHKMIDGWKQHYELEPAIEGDFDYYKITFPTITTQKTVEKTVEKILEAIKKNPKITQNEFAEITGLTRRGIEWNLAKLKEKGIIKRIGSPKGGHWEVIKK